MTPQITLTPALWRRRPAELCQIAGVYQGQVQRGDLIEVKHDGWRFLWIDGKPYTRNGMPFRGIAHIERAMALLEAQFDEPMFFDGEFVVGKGPDTLKQTKAHQDRGWKAGDAGRVHLFDALPMSEWRYADGDTPLVERKKALGGGFVEMMHAPEAWEMGWTDGVECPLAPVSHEIAANEYTVDRLAKAVWADGGEGLVVKDANAPYRRARGDAWLKVKRKGMR